MWLPVIDGQALLVPGEAEVQVVQDHAPAGMRQGVCTVQDVPFADGPHRRPMLGQQRMPGCVEPLGQQSYPVARAEHRTGPGAKRPGLYPDLDGTQSCIRTGGPDPLQVHLPPLRRPIGQRAEEVGASSPRLQREDSADIRRTAQLLETVVQPACPLGHGTRAGESLQQPQHAVELERRRDPELEKEILRKAAQYFARWVSLRRLLGGYPGAGRGSSRYLYDVKYVI
jgi:hypothetical protein